jgi:hypothetical protein
MPVIATTHRDTYLQDYLYFCSLNAANGNSSCDPSLAVKNRVRLMNDPLTFSKLSAGPVTAATLHVQRHDANPGGRVCHHACVVVSPGNGMPGHWRQSSTVRWCEAGWMDYLARALHTLSPFAISNQNNRNLREEEGKGNRYGDE